METVEHPQAGLSLIETLAALLVLMLFHALLFTEFSFLSRSWNYARTQQQKLEAIRFAASALPGVLERASAQSGEMRDFTFHPQGSKIALSARCRTVNASDKEAKYGYFSCQLVPLAGSKSTEGVPASSPFNIVERLIIPKK